MRWLIDENLASPSLSQFFQLQGKDARAAPSGIANSELASLAKKEDRILLTHDKGFANILAYPPDRYPGIVRVNIHPPYLDRVIAALTQLLAQLDPSVFPGRLITLDPGGFRVYPELSPQS